jgi:ribosomal protein S18 acetylase RimI-like enzyme
MIIIQRPIEDDVREIQDVFYKTWLATYPNEEAGVTVADIEEKFKNRFSQENIEKRIKNISDASSDKLFLVAKDENAIIGVCLLRKEEACHELMAIYVLPDHQRKGIGRMFWERAAEFFGSEKDIIVHVAVYNEKAINFYKKVGFSETGKEFKNEKYKMPISGSYIIETELIIKARKY